MADVRRNSGDPGTGRITGSSAQICRYDELPVWKKIYMCPHVVSGYLTDLSTLQCLKSTYKLTNETGNVLTHVVPAMAFLILALYDHHVTIPGRHGDDMDYVISAIYFTSCQVVLLFSTTYHIFTPHRCRSVFTLGLGLDLFGIVVTILSVLSTFVAYCFKCSMFWQMFYQCLCVAMVIPYAAMFLHPKYRFHWVRPENRLIGIGPPLAIVSFAFIAQSYHYHGGWTSDTAWIYPARCFRNGGIYIAAFVLFHIKNIPQVWFPGRFDYVGHGHQWWHMAVVLGLLDWRDALFVFQSIQQQSLTC
ncbi:PAQR3 [Branchiostoma lanceolatum]|uniref:PAQR3 protein n=1 Tax=Branchiostoma lanceolatum TaxID=7740 RepID=A0A8J9VT10_BRALA|nr:PAQR3 [Branchiostoma lanceolatum]